MQAKCDGDEGQRQRVALEEKTRRNVQDADEEDDHCWTEACEGIAKRMSKCSEDSEVTRVSTRGLKEQVLSPSESSLKNCAHIARQARNGKNKIAISDFKTRSERGLHRQYGEMGGTIERSGDAGEALPDAQGGSGTLSERQDVLTDLMERKMNTQKTAPEKDQEKIPEEPKELEWQRTTEALELVQRQHKLISAGLLHKKSPSLQHGEEEHRS